MKTNAAERAVAAWNGGSPRDARSHLVEHINSYDGDWVSALIEASPPREMMAALLEVNTQTGVVRVRRVSN